MGKMEKEQQHYSALNEAWEDSSEDSEGGAGAEAGGEGREEYILSGPRQGPPPRKGDRGAAYSTTHTGSLVLAGPSDASVEGNAIGK